MSVIGFRYFRVAAQSELHVGSTFDNQVLNRRYLAIARGKVLVRICYQPVSRREFANSARIADLGVYKIQAAFEIRVNIGNQPIIDVLMGRFSAHAASHRRIKRQSADHQTQNQIIT
ncbi:MAG: hypothetical protein ACD_39C00922G0001 [uncultured bacterium]|nr:MAG: hypothetical protein ACD_39C00922G0001 [uncultured bacterium]